jgi:hypothetical protein
MERVLVVWHVNFFLLRLSSLILQRQSLFDEVQLPFMDIPGLTHLPFGFTIYAS